MQMSTDAELLRRYAEGGDEAAFAEVVQRHADLVYSAAMRLAGGDGQLAQDAAQQVFTKLARKTGSLSGRATVAGWLHTSARYAASAVVRGERRRRAREQEASIMNEPTTAEGVDWERLRPLLDEAVGRLREGEREAVLLRYFEGLSHRDVGAALGLSEDTARKRVDRAVEKLRGHFARRGVVVTAGALAGVMSTHSVQAAPAGLAASWSGTALAGAGNMGWLERIFYMTTKTKMAAVTLAALIGLAAWQGRERGQLRAEIAAAQAENGRLAQEEKNLAAVAQAGPRLKSYTDAEIAAEVKAGLRGLADDWAGTPEDWLSFIYSLRAEDVPRVLASIARQADAADAGSEQNNLLSEIGIAVAGKNPASLAAMVAALPAGQGRDQVLAGAAGELAQNDATQAATLAGQITDAWMRREALDSVVEAVAQKDPAGALALLPQIGHESGQTETMTAMVQQWAEVDPAAAANYVAGLPSGPRMAALEGMAETLGAKDPAAAMAWAEGMPDGVEKSAVMSTLVTSWAGSDAPGLLAWAEQQPEGSIKQSALVTGAEQLALADPAAAANYAANLTAGAMQDQALAKILKIWASSDAPAAAAYVLQMPAGKMSAAAPVLVREWVRGDPAAAGNFVMQLPAGGTRDDGAGQVADLWMEQDAAGAQAWTATLPEGSTRDAALVGEMDHLTAGQKFSQAAQLAGQLSQPEKQGNVLEELGQDWLQSNERAAATAWVQQTTSLTDAQKQKLLNPPTKQGP
jgi:RNA polymerase sigma factor (sigma-70 family)